MADLKISQLTAATTPLAGTELVPVVQSGSTKKVAVSDLTAGREFAAKSITLSGDSAYTQGKFFITSGEGTMIACKTGSFFDAALLAAGLTSYVWTVATGTNNIKFWNDVTLGNASTNVHTINGLVKLASADKGLQFEGNNNAIWRVGAGSPEGVLTAPVGSLYTRTDGGANTTLYVKESGTGNTGWVAK